MPSAPILYLHGFASGPRSRKGTFFSDHLRARGFRVDAPALDGGDFEHLTITAQLEIIRAATVGQPCILIGSSLGGYLAALYSARHPEVLGAILLAPAFNFYARWRERMSPDEWDRWSRGNPLEVFSYAEGRPLPVDFGLMRDAAAYEAFPDFRQPTLIFHGTADPVVPVEYSAGFARGKKTVQFIELSSGHELTDVLDQIVPFVETFLEHYGRL